MPKAEREVLIKAVAQSITTYVMSCFKITKNCCKEIKFILAKFDGAKKTERGTYTGCGGRGWLYPNFREAWGLDVSVTSTPPS